MLLILYRLWNKTISGNILLNGVKQNNTVSIVTIFSEYNIYEQCGQYIRNQLGLSWVVHVVWFALIMLHCTIDCKHIDMFIYRCTYELMNRKADHEEVNRFTDEWMNKWTYQQEKWTQTGDEMNRQTDEHVNRWTDEDPVNSGRVDNNW